MEIILKNGQKINLEISSLILEYVEDYKGGLKQLLEDAQGKADENGYTRAMYATNHLLYSVIASNYDEELTYRQAIRLVRIEDIEKIVKFVIENVAKIKLEENTKIEKEKMNNTLHRIK